MLRLGRHGQGRVRAPRDCAHPSGSPSSAACRRPAKIGRRRHGRTGDAKARQARVARGPADARAAVWAGPGGPELACCLVGHRLAAAAARRRCVTVPTDAYPFSPFSGVDFPHNLYRTVSNEYRSSIERVSTNVSIEHMCVRYTLDTKPGLWWGLSSVSSSGYRANFGAFCIVHISYMYQRSIVFCIVLCIVHFLTSVS